MTSWIPECTRCRRPNPHSWSRCPACGGVQLVGSTSAWDADTLELAEGIWRHRPTLPPVGQEISLGEGNTPLVSFPRFARELGIAEVLVKNESVNPTLSFKDRAMALGVSLAVDFAAHGVVAASTGNTAASAAAYAARAGLPCRIRCAAGAAGSHKLRTARAFGARIETVDGDFSDAHAAAAGLESSNWFPLTTTFRNPYLVDAHRTVAAELAVQAGRVPDWVFVPVGAGPLLVGTHRGFGPRAPRMVAVQAEACAPLVQAWHDGCDPVAVQPQATVAEAIADPLRGYTDEGALTLRTIAESGGEAVSVTDEEIMDATRNLAGGGLLVEPAAAAPLAALRRLVADGTVTSQACVVLLVTGHGAKEGSDA